MIFLRTLFADVEIGVGFFVANGRKRKNPHFKIALQQQRERPLGGGLASGIGVVVHYDALGEAAEQLDLLLRETGSATGRHVTDSRARHGNRVHVTFDQYHEVLAADALFRAVQVIQHVAFGIDGRFGRIQIFRLVVAQCAAPKGHDFPRFVCNRKRDAPAETIE